MMHAKKILRDKMQPFFGKVGWKSFCKLGLNGLDEKLEKYLDYTGGRFIEAGAFNGLSQSNTYYLEAVKGWSGILVEPVVTSFKACVRNRPKATCVHAALVSSDYTDKYVLMECAGLMTSVSDKSGNTFFDKNHIREGRSIQSLAEENTCKVRAITLDSLFSEYDIGKIDFLSLDLEGYELNALRGLDLTAYGPEWLLLEVRDRFSIEEIIKDFYETVEILTENEKYNDILYRRRS